MSADRRSAEVASADFAVERLSSTGVSAADDRWISAVNAVEGISARRGVGSKAARRILAEARASDEVQQRPGGSGPVRLGPSGLVYMYGNDVNLADLKYWMNDFYPVRPMPNKTSAAETLTGWALTHVDRTRSKIKWHELAKAAHPQYNIPRELWRRVWNAVPAAQKLKPGEKPLAAK